MIGKVKEPMKMAKDRDGWNYACDAVVGLNSLKNQKKILNLN